MGEVVVLDHLLCASLVEILCTCVKMIKLYGICTVTFKVGKHLEGCCQARNCTILCCFLIWICFMSHHASKCFIQKVLRNFIFLYFACCWDCSGTPVHIWSESHNFCICVHCCSNILSNQLTVAYCHALHFSIFGLVV